MTKEIANNKRIAKNTLFLYIRTLITMAVSLYTSRLILSTLGVEDFGIYNVVGGIVVFLSFLNTSMASATQRFLNVGLGKNSGEMVKKVFSNSLIIHFYIAAIVVLLSETIGVWFLNEKMNIVEERIVAANYVFQFSIATMVTTVLSVPYNAVIIANEKMSAFAYISIIEVSLKLLLVLLLTYSPFDKLITYAGLMFLISLVIRIIYGVYCNRHFEECQNIKYKPDAAMIKQMMSFSLWTVVGAIASISHSQGIAIVMNLFFGVIVNAAFGVASQVNQVVSNFVNNFMTALNPQIVKSYSANELSSMHQLMSRGCRMGFFLVLFFIVPISIEAPFLLGLWLKEVPEYTVGFVRLVLVIMLFNSFASPLSAAQGATGNIKKYQIVLTTLGLLHLPIAWFCFAGGLSPYYAMYSYLLIVLLEQAFRIFYVSRSISMPLFPFLKAIVLKCGGVSVLSFMIPVGLHLMIPNGFFSSIFVCAVSVICVVSFVFALGVDANERNAIVSVVRSNINKKN